MGRSHALFCIATCIIINYNIYLLNKITLHMALEIKIPHLLYQMNNLIPFPQWHGIYKTFICIKRVLHWK